MRESLPIFQSSCFLSLLVLPRAQNSSNSQYNTLEDTLARANSWLNTSQDSGVPIVFMNVQSESLLTKVFFLLLNNSGEIYRLLSDFFFL